MLIFLFLPVESILRSAENPSSETWNMFNYKGVVILIINIRMTIRKKSAYFEFLKDSLKKETVESYSRFWILKYTPPHINPFIYSKKKYNSCNKYCRLDIN